MNAVDHYLMLPSDSHLISKTTRWTTCKHRFGLVFFLHGSWISLREKINPMSSFKEESNARGKL